MNGTERRRKSRELEKQGLARVTIIIILERVGDMLREARLIDPLGEDDKATIARGVEKLLELVDAARGDPDLQYVFSLFADDLHNIAAMRSAEARAWASTQARQFVEAQRFKMLGAGNYSGVQLAEQAGAACPVVEHLKASVVGISSDASQACGAGGALISPSALAGGFANAMRGFSVFDTIMADAIRCDLWTTGAVLNSAPVVTETIEGAAKLLGRVLINRQPNAELDVPPNVRY